MAGYEEWDTYEQEEYRRRVRRMKQRRIKKRRKNIIRMSLLVLFLLSILVGSILVSRHYKEEPVESQLGSETTVGNAGGAMLDLRATGEAIAFTEVPAAQQKPDAAATIGSVGDVVMHLPIIKAYGGMQTTAEHDFKPALETFRSVYESVDCMVANFETSLGGPEKAFSGFPNFNAPDSIAWNLKEMGIDLQLLANNHVYDNKKDGFLRTMDVLDQYGIVYTGSRKSAELPAYCIVDLNGIRIGIVNYTYEMEHEGERKSINGNIMDESVENLLNSFELSELKTFYAELAQQVDSLRNQGCEFLIAYMHWGNEYELTQNESQVEIAQHLCDLGIDAIIGGHPHVVQPVDVLTSTDGSHKMLCAYSLGNHFTNQRREQISSRPNGHTEDGLYLQLTISRVNGIVSIANIQAIPTYVYKNNVPKYYVIPIFDPMTVEQQTGISGIQATIQASYDRTVKILGNDIEDAKRELGILIE